MQIEKKVIDNVIYIAYNVSDVEAVYPDLKQRNIGGVLLSITEEYNHIKTDIWYTMTEVVNEFFKVLSIDDQYKFITTVHDILMDAQILFIPGITVYHNSIVNKMEYFGSLLTQLDKEIDLIPKIYMFVDEHIYIGDFSKAGTSPQDKKEITYMASDARDVTAMALLSKLIFPIFGVLLAAFKKNDKNDDKIKRYKEIYCSLILNDLIETRFKYCIDKLHDFIRYYAEKQYNDAKSMKDFSSDDKLNEFTSGAFIGITTDSLVENTKANILIKSCVNSSLSYVNSGKTIITYLHGTIVDSISKKLRERTDPTKAYHIRQDISRTDDNEIPQFEIDSQSSEDTLDILELIATEIPDIALNEAMKHNADTIYQHGVDFYVYNGLVPSYVSQLCLCHFYGDRLGGGEGVLYINNKQYSMLVSAFQLYLADQHMYELLHFMTARPVGTKMNPTSIDIRLSSDLTTISAQCKGKYVHVKHIFENSRKMILDTIITTQFVYNTADAIWDHIGHPNLNKEAIGYTTNLLKDIFYVLKNTY